MRKIRQSVDEESSKLRLRGPEKPKRSIIAYLNPRWILSHISKRHSPEPKITSKVYRLKSSSTWTHPWSNEQWQWAISRREVALRFTASMRRLAHIVLATLNIIMNSSSRFREIIVIVWSWTQESPSLQSRVTWTKETRSVNFHLIPSKSNTDTKKAALVSCISSSMRVLNSGLGTSNSLNIHQSTWQQQTSIKLVLDRHYRKLTRTMVPRDQIWWNLSKFQEVLMILQVLSKKHLEMTLQHPLTTISTNKATMRNQLRTICKPRANSQSI